MVWHETSKSFKPSQAGLERYRQKELARARELLAEGYPGIAHAILPERAPEELIRDIASACERVFLKALREAKPTNEIGEKANPVEARALKLEMLEHGLECAPDSHALKQQITALRAQVEADRERRALELERQARHKKLEEERLAKRNAEAILAKVIGSGWECGDFAFRLLPGRRAKFVTRDWDGSLHWVREGKYETETRGAELVLRFLESGRTSVTIFINRVSSSQLHFGTTPGSGLSTWCNATNQI